MCCFVSASPVQLPASHIVGDYFRLVVHERKTVCHDSKPLSWVQPKAWHRRCFWAGCWYRAREKRNDWYRARYRGCIAIERPWMLHTILSSPKKPQTKKRVCNLHRKNNQHLTAQVASLWGRCGIEAVNPWLAFESGFRPDNYTPSVTPMKDAQIRSRQQQQPTTSISSQFSCLFGARRL